MRLLSIVTVAAVLASGGALAQTPAVTNGTLETRTVARGLAGEVAAIAERSTAPAWIGYAVKVPVRDTQDGCWSADRGFVSRPLTTLKLEGPDELFVLYRVSNKQVERIKIASADCPIDAGGLTLHWLSGVTSSESLDFLMTFTSADATRRLANSAIVAIALHGDPASLDRLMTLARGGKDGHVRADALFWVAQRAGDKAVGAITDAIDRDPDTEVKKRAVFALSQLPRDEGVPKLIDVARNNRNREVRRQAMFWLGQSNDPRALKFFEEILRP
jgi:HEAT repeat protein